jgi:branched-subunit amino acid ABC-type transport system permease component
MNLPPGPLYLLRLFLRNLPTTLAWYGILRLLLFYRGLALPTWLAAVGASLLIQPVVMVYWRKHRNRVKAAGSGAVLVKQVQGGSVSISQALVRTLESGYPGEFVHVRIAASNVFCRRCIP